MSSEVVSILITDRDGCYADGTLGEGGHAKAILETLEPAGRLFGVDRDPEALAIAGSNLRPFGDRARLALANFRDLPAVIPPEWHGKISGILLDLGLRSSALDQPERGFSFQNDGPLDMRFNPQVGPSAAELLARMRPQNLQRIMEAGTTRASPRAVVRAIVAWRDERRPLHTTGDLVRCLRKGLGRKAGPKLLSSVFSALRMEVNREMEDLDEALATLPALLKTGGVLCVLAYQSQEDRRVKLAGRGAPQDPSAGIGVGLEPLLKKPLRPTAEECRRNRRARSATLRALRRIPVVDPT